MNHQLNSNPHCANSPQSTDAIIVKPQDWNDVKDSLLGIIKFSRELKKKIADQAHKIDENFRKISNLEQQLNNLSGPITPQELWALIADACKSPVMIPYNSKTHSCRQCKNGQMTLPLIRVKDVKTERISVLCLAHWKQYIETRNLQVMFPHNHGLVMTRQIQVVQITQS